MGARPRTCRDGKRCAGMPVDLETARVWVAKEIFPAGRADAGDADVVAPAAATYCRRRAHHSTPAESAHADKRATGQWGQRPQWVDRASDTGSDSEGGTGSR